MITKIYKKDSFYWSKTWRDFRKKYLARHPFCVVPNCGELATHLDHIIPRSRGGADFPDDSGLQGLCAAHHNTKTAAHDKPGKSGIYKHRIDGCNSDGMPNDPNHHWNK